jgi:hypothetical protein
MRLPTVNNPPKHRGVVGAAVYVVVGASAIAGATVALAVLEVLTRRWPTGPTPESVVVTVPTTSRRWVVS